MTKLEQAARALLAHWDTPAWKYLKPTGDLMADLREALAEQAAQEPVHEALQIASVALQDIACSSQTDSLLWWQLRARKAQKQIAELLTSAAPQPTQKVSESVTEQEPVCKTCEALARTVMMDQIGKA